MKKMSNLKQLFSKYQVELAYVFGSFATGESTNKSDVDIAVLFGKELSAQQRFELRLQLMSALGKIFKKNIDLVVLNDLRSLFFKYVIVKEGKFLHAKSEERKLDFESKLLGAYFDFSPFLEAYNRQYVENSLQ